VPSYDFDDKNEILGKKCHHGKFLLLEEILAISQRIELTLHNLTNEKMLIAMEKLRDNKEITNLYLDECELGLSEGKKLSQLLKANSTVSQLCFYNCKLNDECLKEFSNGL